MEVIYEEKSGAGIFRRLSALLLVLAGGVGAWAWLNLHAPEYVSQMQILTADTPNAAGLTEQLLATSLSDAHLTQLAADLAKEIATAEHEKSVLHNFLDLGIPTDEQDWQSRFKACFTTDWVRERVLQISLRYATFGTPRQAEILQKIYQNMEHEFQQQVAQFNTAQQEMRTAKVKKIEAQLANLPDISAAQRLIQAAADNLTASVNKGENLPVAWENAWRDYPEMVTYLDAVKTAWRAWTESNLQMAQAEKTAQELKAWINLPQNQTIKQSVKRVVYYDDTPELRRLKDQKAEIEASRMILLQRATTLHPQAQKMAAEIAELNAQINALTRLPQTVEDFEERTNPQLLNWQRELSAVEGVIGGQQLLVNTRQMQLSTAIKNLRVATDDALNLRYQTTRAQIENELVAAKNAPLATLPTAFGLYLSPTAPTRLVAADYWRVYAIGIGGGMLCALLTIWTRRNAKVVYREPPPRLPEYPLLGTVPDFRHNA